MKKRIALALSLTLLLAGCQSAPAPEGGAASGSQEPPETTNLTGEVVSNTLTIGDMPLCEFYRDDGKTKPLVILLHGGGGSKDETIPWAEDLAHQGFYALAVDAAAHGDSKLGPLDAVLCWSTTVTQIDGVIEHYADVPQADTEHFGLAGSSMGGTTCFAYVAHGKYTPDVIAPSVGSADFTALPESPLYDRYGEGDSDEPGMSREEVLAFAEEYSPVNFPERFLDVYIYSQTGMEDPIGNPASVKPLEDALQELGGTKFVFEYYEGVGHEGSPDFDPNRALRQVLLGDTSNPVFD